MHHAFLESKVAAPHLLGFFSEFSVCCFAYRNNWCQDKISPE